MSGTRRKPQPTAELVAVSVKARKVDRAQERLDAARLELAAAIAAAVDAGATLRPIAEAAGRSVETIRQALESPKRV